MKDDALQLGGVVVRACMYLHFFLPLLPLLNHTLLEAMQLRLRHVFGMVGIVGQQQQLLIVMLFGLEERKRGGDAAMNEEPDGCGVHSP